MIFYKMICCIAVYLITCSAALAVHELSFEGLILKYDAHSAEIEVIERKNTFGFHGGVFVGKSTPLIVVNQLREEGFLSGEENLSLYKGPIDADGILVREKRLTLALLEELIKAQSDNTPGQ